MSSVAAARRDAAVVRRAGPLRRQNAAGAVRAGGLPRLLSAVADARATATRVRTEARVKIAFIMYQGNMYSGGQGVYLHYITRELVRAGHEVHVISGRPYPRLADGVVHHRTPHATASGHSSTAAMSTPTTMRTIRGVLPPVELLRVRVDARVARRRSSSPSACARTGSSRELEARGAPFDLVHDNQTLGYGVLAMKRLMGKPVVASLHHPLAIDKANNMREAKNVVSRVAEGDLVPVAHAVVRRQPHRCRAHRLAQLRALRQRAAWTSRSSTSARRRTASTTTSCARCPMRARQPGTILFVGDSEDRNKGARFLIEACARPGRRDGLPPSLQGQEGKGHEGRAAAGLEVRPQPLRRLHRPARRPTTWCGCTTARRSSSHRRCTRASACRRRGDGLRHARRRHDGGRVPRVHR